MLDLDHKIDTKLSRLPGSVRLVEPDQLPSETQADWLISLLCRMYVNHGITKRRSQLLTDIQSRSCRCWFATDNGEPVAAAALVSQSDGSVEIGRAVSFTNGLGGLLMLLAAKNHLTTSFAPLVAEIRVSDQFAGIPSGEATQNICFNQLELIPHALVPAFNHGHPIRQENFLFSSSNPITGSEPAVLPSEPNSLDFLCATAIQLSAGNFHQNIEVVTSKEQVLNSGWEVINSAPFSIMLPSSSPSSFEKAANKAERHAPFTLLPLTASPSNTALMVECLNQGFIPCGIDRNLDVSGHPIILFGHLKPGTLVAPVRPLQAALNSNQLSAINIIDRSFRS